MFEGDLSTRLDRRHRINGFYRSTVLQLLLGGQSQMKLLAQRMLNELSLLEQDLDNARMLLNQLEVVKLKHPEHSDEYLKALALEEALLNPEKTRQRIAELRTQIEMVLNQTSE